MIDGPLMDPENVDVLRTVLARMRSQDLQGAELAYVDLVANALVKIERAEIALVRFRESRTNGDEDVSASFDDAERRLEKATKALKKIYRCKLPGRSPRQWVQFGASFLGDDRFDVQ